MQTINRDSVLAEPTGELKKRTDTIANLIGPVRWLAQDEGFVECPGASSHSQRNGKRDCKLYLKPVPTLTCFHSSCSGAVKAANQRLRQALANETSVGSPRRITSEEKRRRAEIQLKEDIRRRAAASFDRIQTDYRWPLEANQGDSPARLCEDESQHWGPLLEMFSCEDVIWIGGILDSGQAAHASCFRTKEQWLQESAAPGQFICPAVFRLGACARSNANVQTRRFLVIESDDLSKDQVGAVFKWVRDAVGLSLRAIVDTGGKSLHGWFDFPNAEVMEDLKLVLPELGCDPKLFTASQPVRLPGALREGRFQRLVWLQEGGVR